MRTNYHTKQKEKIITLMKKFDKEFTIKELYEELNGQIGLTTIYRFAHILIKEGTVIKLPGVGNNTYYQYLKECPEENHFYLKCEKCGEMIHVDCDCIRELSAHIKKEHQFQLKKDNILIEGFCNRCIKGDD